MQLQRSDKYVHRTCNLGWFTFLHLAFQLGHRKKEADACIRPDQFDYPSVVLEVGSSESLTQLKTDARLWIEHVPEVCQSCPLLPPTQWNFFRYR